MKNLIHFKVKARVDKLEFLIQQARVDVILSIGTIFAN